MRFSRQGEALRVQTPGKINLSLEIRGRRTDGYHDLRTLMVSVNLVDTLLFRSSPTGDIALRIHSASGPKGSAAALPVDDRNLIIKAARLLQHETQHSGGVDITLWKRIPSEAGLGGGSSDAAATLMALNQFWELNLGLPRLHELAATLGSDVNFFLNSLPAAICTGRGEEIAPQILPRTLHVVLIKPPFGLSTGRVFQCWSPQKSSGKPDRSTFESHTISDLQKILKNDLEGPAGTLDQRMQQLLTRLRQLDVIGCGMTGSGSACFALCRTNRHARTIAGRCREWNAGRVFVVASGV